MSDTGRVRIKIVRPKRQPPTGEGKRQDRNRHHFFPFQARWEGATEESASAPQQPKSRGWNRPGQHSPTWPTTGRPAKKSRPRLHILGVLESRPFKGRGGVLRATTSSVPTPRFSRTAINGPEGDPLRA